ncbi:hypothetical protein IKN40_00285 [bacterium]|nr:hypothetical protein [bacterium]
MFGKTNSSTLVNGSYTKGVSVSHENSSTSSPIINNNISINQGENVEKDTHSLDQRDIQIIDNQQIEYPPKNIPKDNSLQCENNFLKAILRIYIGQKIYFNGKYIVCTLSELVELIQLLTNCEAEIEVEPFEVSCCGANSSPYSKVSNIWIIKDGQKSIFKYVYSQFLSLFDEFKISLKVVRV